MTLITNINSRMCEFIGNKIVFGDGTEISLDNFVLDNLTQTQLKSLNESYASKYDILLIRKNLHTIRNDIHKIVADTDIRCKKYESQITEIKEMPKRSWKTIVSYAKDLGIILALISYFITMLK